MSYSLTWLPDVLRAAGLRVAEVDGWRDRGHGDIGNVVGVICHHTAGSRQGNMPSLWTLIDGRPDLAGPLSQLGLGRDGTFYVVAAGRCYHAGVGSWQGITDGNGHFIGIEAENTGNADDHPWPEVQYAAYQQGVAALMRRVGTGVAFVAGHREYAPHRKNDPDFDMDAFRDGVAAILDGRTPPIAPISAKESGPAGRSTLQRGDRGELIAAVQRAVGVPDDGVFGPRTEAAVRAFQRASGLVPDGIVGPQTWAAIP